jgi:hypothetical protein
MMLLAFLSRLVRACHQSCKNANDPKTQKEISKKCGDRIRNPA